MLQFDWRALGVRAALWAFEEGYVWGCHVLNRGVTLHIGKFTIRIELAS